MSLTSNQKLEMIKHSEEGMSVRLKARLLSQLVKLWMQRDRSWKEVNWCGKVHGCLIWRNGHSQPSLQRPPPWSFSSHQQRAKRLRLTEGLSGGLHFLAMKPFLIKMHTLFFYAVAHLRLQYSVNVTCACTGKPKKFVKLLYCSGMDPHPQCLRGTLVL